MPLSTAADPSFLLDLELRRQPVHRALLARRPRVPLVHAAQVAGRRRGARAGHRQEQQANRGGLGRRVEGAILQDQPT